MVDAPANDKLVPLKNTLEKVTSTFDANHDGTFDIQDIIILAIRLPGTHVTRDSFLRKELSKNHPESVVDDAITRTPALAGISSEEIERIADEVINFERMCVSGISALLGVPGGLAMAATIPADLIQYYQVTLRAIQKLLYLYGFPEIDSDEEGISLDTATVNRMLVCLGVMYGVAGANNAIKALAKALANGVEKKLLNAALTKGALFPILRRVMTWFGVKLTKKMVASFAKKAIPVVGGVVGGTLTFLSFKPCCNRLKGTLSDTSLSNLNHVPGVEEEHVYTHIITGTVYDADLDKCTDEEYSSLDAAFAAQDVE